MPSCNRPLMGILQEEIKKDHKCRIIHPTHAIQSIFATVVVLARFCASVYAVLIFSHNSSSHGLFGKSVPGNSHFFES
ncbi:hypothetical protein SPSIL_024580 [Sporomusa silvacetica DSM 10669]|uniref:Transmembrane protein n=1 Tax=Sporomusa silvacetica DSM 10669 TaxID=1123289 RepID=A0ABZ3ILM0_9FIRM|nr:hypothetical protein SPSIL_04800 [Sporomusa silvacetica DSM 10669]